MKKFALFLPNEEQARIVEGSSADVTRKKGDLRVVVSNVGKRQIFNGVICFCEVSKDISVQ